MDFKKILTAPLHAGQAVVRNLMDNPDQASAKEEVAQLLAQQGGEDVRRFTPEMPKREWSLPDLDDSLTEEALARKAEMEAAGEPFVPTEADFRDGGPFGYLHKKAIHDAFQEYERELQAARPNIDFEGITRSRISDLMNAPEPHRTNPLFKFAMAMGNPDDALELVREYNKGEDEKNLQQAQRWQSLLDMKKDALEASIKSAMQEGDARKVISGKWLETLAQIEQDKAKLSGQLQQIGERNAGAERRAELRGRWALAAVNARANAMLQAVGIREGSLEHRNMMDNARSMLNMLVKKGETYESAYDKVEDWLTDQLEDRPTAQSAPRVPTVGASPSAPVTRPANEMEAEILRGRKR